LTAIEYFSSNTLKHLTATETLNNQSAQSGHANSTATSKRELKHLTAIDTLNNLKKFQTIEDVICSIF
jgi:hypothetical protein